MKKKWVVQWMTAEDGMRRGGHKIFKDQDSAIAFAETVDAENTKVSIVPLVKCCDEWIFCDTFTNSCGKCGALYNFAGQELKPMNEWEEDY
jgi:hypothetical protein